MAQDEQPQPTSVSPSSSPSQLITVDVPGMGIRGFPTLAVAKAAVKDAQESRSFQVQGEGPSISGMLKKLLTPEAAGLVGFGLGGPVGAGAAATAASLGRNVAKGEPLDPLAAGEHMLVNAGPGVAANMAGRIPSALAKGSTHNTGGSVMRALGEILGGGTPATAEDMVVGRALTSRGPALGKGAPILSSGTHAKVGQLAADAENALAATVGKGAGAGKVLIGSERADMARRARQLTEAFDAIGGLRKGTGGTLPPEIVAILKRNGLNPKTIQDLWHQRIALGGHGLLAGGAAELEP